MENLEFDVTTEDIAAGKKAHPNSCPIALAVQRHYQLSEPVIVGPVNIIIGNYGYLLDDASLEFRRAFDAGLPVQPCKIRTINTLCFTSNCFVSNQISKRNAEEKICDY